MCYNIFKVKYNDGVISFNDGNKIQLPADIIKGKKIPSEVLIGIRPEDIHDENVVIETYKDSTVNLKVDVAELLGAETLIYAGVNTQPIVAKVNARVDVHMNDDILLAFDMNKCHFFDIETDLRIKKN